jgi:hypothetical protein
MDPAAASLGGKVARAPSGVPGVTVDDEGAGLAAGAGTDEAGEPPEGVAMPWLAPVEEAGAGAEEAGAEEAGAAGAVSGASARLQPATSTAPSSETAINGVRSARVGVTGKEQWSECFMVVLEQVESGALGGRLAIRRMPRRQREIARSMPDGTCPLNLPARR